jgi:hypothetical protein
MQQEEKTIQKLFQQLKREDERHAPPFARAWANARARDEQHASGWRLGWPSGWPLGWPLGWIAAAALALLACGAAWWRLHGTEMLPPLPLDAAFRAPKPDPLHSSAPPKPAGSKRAVRQRHARSRPQPEPMLLSQWRSPTKFLLRLPGDPLLKTVPRFGESWLEIKTLVPEQKKEWEEQ